MDASLPPGEIVSDKYYLGIVRFGMSDHAEPARFPRPREGHAEGHISFRDR